MESIKNNSLIVLFLCFIFASCTNSTSRANNNTATNNTATTDNTTTSSMSESSPLNIPNNEPLGEKTLMHFGTNLFPDIEGLYYSKLQDLTFLLNDTSITSLWLDSGSFSDLSPLGELSQLEALSMTWNINISDLTPLMGLKNLKMFEMYRSNSVIDISPLAGLSNMRYLSLQLKNLQETDCIELINMQQLKELHFTIGNIISVNNISCLKNIKVLSLDVSCVGDDSISSLTNLTDLQSIELFGVRYTDTVDDYNIKPLKLEWIAPLIKLESIRLEGFDIEDISPLAKLPNLEVIDVNRSRVHDYYPLINSKSLKSILTPVLRGIDTYPNNFYAEDKVLEAFSGQTLRDLQKLFHEKKIGFSPLYDH